MTLSPLLSRLWRAVLLGALIVTGHASFAEDVIEAKAKICATCHGEQGVPMQKAFPVIWGQNAGYLFLQFARPAVLGSTPLAMNSSTIGTLPI